MKQIKTFAFSACCLVGALIFSGCPVSISYPLAESGTVKIDKNLVGNWKATETEVEIAAAKVEKMDDNNYKITISEKGSLYTPEGNTFKGWNYEMEGHKFLICQEYDEAEALTDKYYLYKIECTKSNLTLYDVSLTEGGGTDAIKSTADFQRVLKLNIDKGNCFTLSRTFLKE